MAVKIFVAHAHADRLFAEAFVDLLRKSYAIDDQEICCSSTVGFGTPPKDPIAQAIGRIVDSANAVVTLVSPRSKRSTYVASEVGAARARGIPLYIVRLPGGNADPTLAGDQRIQDASKPGDLIDVLESIRVEADLAFRTTEATRNEDVGRFVRVAGASSIRLGSLGAAALLTALLLSLLWQPSEDVPRSVPKEQEAEPNQKQRGEPARRVEPEQLKGRAQRPAPARTDAGDAPARTDASDAPSELVKTSSKLTINSPDNEDAWSEAVAFKVFLNKACKPTTGGQLSCHVHLATLEGVPCTWSKGKEKVCTVRIPKNSGGIVKNNGHEILARIAEARCCGAR